MQKGLTRVAQVVEYLPNKHEALSSTSDIAKKEEAVQLSPNDFY
jgi:hypothetical protein